jgi:hypothetical protein
LQKFFEIEIDVEIEVARVSAQGFLRGAAAQPRLLKIP